MAAYKDPQFGTPYASNEIVLGSEIYVALYVYPTDGDTYVLRLEDCAASPTADRSDTKALRLISQGCANDSLTQIIQNGNSREVRMKIRSSQFQDFTTVYLFCDARLCVKSAEECTACKSQSFSMGVTQLQLDLRLKGNLQQLEQGSLLAYDTLYGGSSRAAIVGLWLIIWRVIHSSHCCVMAHYMAGHPEQPLLGYGSLYGRSSRAAIVGLGPIIWGGHQEQPLLGYGTLYSGSSRAANVA
ncbi:pancreatic secretory granule membrane major glycoprotein GP2-like [Rana temporaria]|uniref:pancreatic secretory granule membrane major glycoprotein GP2-like n=1 Tax=Rana temporaria TaxID=8407 RepID=UPI001AAE1614|nr:pancreatic secretory granule membrane major glycoprotein GP2-like [Rana temporaria]XP_040190477.1 pancreatic secretory granule membrane major glycoprotein GP2-like [Rana temporaria]